MIFLSLLIFLILTIVSMILYTSLNKPETSLFLLLFSNIFLLFSVLVWIFFESPEETIENFNKISNNIPNYIDEFNSNLSSGFLTYDSEKKIVFVSKSLIDQGFKNLIGESIEVLNLNFSEKNTIEKNIFGISYKVILNEMQSHISLINIEDETSLKIQLKNSSNVLLIIDIFYSNKIRVNEVQMLEYHLKINKFLSDWSKKNSALIRTDVNANEKTTIIVNWELVKSKILKGEFTKELLSTIDEDIKETSISIGASIGNKNFQVMEKNATRALELSKNRGGNQLVLIDEEHKTTIIGKSSQQHKDTSKVEIKLFYDNLISNISKMNNIFITTHLNADIDGIASSIALAKIIKSFNKEEVKIVVQDFDESSFKIFNDLNFEDKLLFINEKEALENSTKNSTVFVLDVSSISRTQAPELVKNISEENRYLIDHHRISANSLEFEHEKTYISISSSSVSEIVSEMIMFSEEEGTNFIDKNILNLLVSGIYLDTNNLTRNTSQTTYDALSFLSKRGANIEKSFEYSKKPLEYSKTLSEFINSITMVKNVAYSFLPENMEASDSEISYASDLLLGFEGIDASFVFAKLRDGNFKLSARSLGNKINVQKTCEKLGGGGHFNSSAVLWNKNNNKYKQVRKKIKDEISKTYIQDSDLIV